MKNLILIILSVGLLTSFTKNDHEIDFNVSFKNSRVIFDFKEGATYQMMFNANRNVLLNENGMVNVGIKSEIDNSDFLIEYSKKGSLVTLKGIKGVHWKDITIIKNSNTIYSIDKNGIKNYPSLAYLSADRRKRPRLCLITNRKQKFNLKKKSKGCGYIQVTQHYENEKNNNHILCN